MVPYDEEHVMNERKQGLIYIWKGLRWRLIQNNIATLQNLIGYIVLKLPKNFNLYEVLYSTPRENKIEN